MNETNQEAQKNSVIKVLAIIGFIGALLFAAWIAVQAVRFLPTAFSALASLAESMREEQDAPFTLVASDSIIQTGDTLTLSWSALRADGDYTFSYQCTEGVFAQMYTPNGDVISIDCDTEMTIADKQTNTRIIFESEKTRFTDVLYTVRFIPANTEDERVEDGVVTIINPNISSLAEAPADEDTVEPEEEAPTPTAPTPTTTGGTQTGGYITVPTTVTKIPVSNPSGYTDLAVTFIGVGTYNTATKKFTKRSSLEEGERGALQFEVRNIGTKTSSTWYMSATLPTDPAVTYASGAQTGLKPNEREVITLQFENASDSDSDRVVISVTGGNDTLTANNTVTERVTVR